ncbi:glycerol-3-phosphate dehydrogenase [Corynebacterium phocae]|uniref:Glycerol-3-phosphate dehydrogenase [NAD(P)+] n=1 Tax=Corynebacterium phocae TaxID=161895 RepID=A0A1L7D3E9_9CORY|nr:NAD(P)H-dependent glycerol-3-phosphate dehydrogenase [Corynebacterium phocae]APT92625.1 glycerol-3-phosphate dehydrogenase [Corynebacterium phocae]KAA8724182.1 NAD(P)-dependent glycerol-3-phosphate dehydrogenase [Corynebacterium phocae]
MVNVAVMGAGTWGTTLAKVFADAGNQVTLWVRREELAQTIATTGRNQDYLPEVELPAAVSATTVPETALKNADIVVFGVPSQQLRPNLEAWAPLLPPESTLVSISKGVETSTLKRMSQVIADATGAAEDRIAVLSGPNLAKEVAAEQPAATVIACSDEARAVAVQEAIQTPYLRPYTNVDVVGVELGGACKNVIALACGMAAGKGLGNNTMATLITRGLAEITRLGVALGADPRTFAGLAGMGDLVATCASTLSRNRTFGYRLGQGGSLEEATAATNGQVAEGVKSSSSIFQLSQQAGVEMPLTQAVFGVCHRGITVDQMVAALMDRETKPE